METQFRMDSKSGSLILVGGTYEPWLSVLEQAGWNGQLCSDLRKADVLFSETGPCIGIIDFSNDEFSLNGIANLVSNHKHVRWLAFIRESQLASDTICQFIVNFCIDFFTAPIPDAQLLSTIGHQLGMLKLEKRVWPHFGKNNDLGLIGESDVLKKLREQVKRIGPTDVTILICGESGVGKERVARAIHQTSSRSQKPFVSVNCRAMSEKRLESALFGIDSESDEKILSLQADGGTLLLNDIVTLPKRQQLNLLKFLQEGCIETQQGMRELDIRILASNSSDIEKALLAGDFSEELYHYINVLRINVPSLKERSSDIPTLAQYFLQLYSKEYNARARSFSEDALKALSSYTWPGNIRELMNLVKRSVLLSETVMLNETDLGLPKRVAKKQSLKKIRENSEREALLMVLDANGGQVSHAAKELGISRATMYRLLNKHKLISDTHYTL